MKKCGNIWIRKAIMCIPGRIGKESETGYGRRPGKKAKKETQKETQKETKKETGGRAEEEAGVAARRTT